MHVRPGAVSGHGKHAAAVVGPPPLATALRVAPIVGRASRPIVETSALLAASLGVVETLTAPNGALGTVAGIGLVALAPSLWRGRARARFPALLLLAVSSLAPLASVVGDTELSAALVLAAILLLGGRAFPSKGDPATRPRLVAGLVIAVAAIIGDLAHNDRLIDHPLVFTFIVSAGVLLVLRALAPWRETGVASRAERLLARSIVERKGVDTLAPFALRADKRYLFSSDRSTFIAYRVVAGVALVSGEPVGDRSAVPALLKSFTEHAEGRGWLVAALGVGPSGLDGWRRLGFRAHYTGEEAIVEPARFSLEGRQIRKVRQSVNRLERAGYRTEFRRTSEISDQLAARLQAIAARWRQGHAETGFSMAFSGAGVDREREDLYAIAYDDAEEPRGFLHFALAPAGSALSLSSMRRDRSAPNGLNEYLVCETLAWAAARDIRRVSLNFAAFAAILDHHGPTDRISELERRTIARLSGHFQLEQLRSFNAKFSPSWMPRYVVYPSNRALPRVVLAAMIAEAYVVLPRLGRRAR